MQSIPAKVRDISAIDEIKIEEEVSQEIPLTLLECFAKAQKLPFKARAVGLAANKAVYTNEAIPIGNTCNFFKFNLNSHNMPGFLTLDNPSTIDVCYIDGTVKRWILVD